MKMKKNIPAYERIPYYYRFFGQKKDERVKQIRASDIAAQLDISTAQTITHDLRSLTDFSGRRNYGYNIIHMHNTLAELLQLKENPSYYYVLGPFYPFLNFTDELQNRNFLSAGQSEVFPDIDILKNEVNIVIVTKKLTEKEWIILEETVPAVLNFSGICRESEKIYIYNLDIIQIILDAQLYLAKG